MKKLLTVVAVLAGIAICADAHAQNDWAGFSRFEQANREQPSAPKAVFMGNSITEGWIGKHPGFFSSNVLLQLFVTMATPFSLTKPSEKE